MKKMSCLAMISFVIRLVTFYQSILLGSKADMDDIVNAITKIYENRSSLA